MCEPITIAAVTATAAGMAIRASAAAGQGSAARTAAESSAAYADRQAADAIIRGALPAVESKVKYGQFAGAQEAHVAASGALVGAGSTADAVRMTKILSKLDEEVIRNNAFREAMGYRSQARAFRQQGENASAAAKNEILTSVIGGVGAMARIGAQAWLERGPGEDDANLENATPGDLWSPSHM